MIHQAASSPALGVTKSFVCGIGKPGLKNISSNASNDVLSLVFSPDGIYLAASGDDYSTLRQSRLTIYDARSLEEITVLSKKEFCYSVAFSPDGKFLAGNVDHELKIWEIGTWRELATWDTSKGFDRSLWTFPHEPSVMSVVISQDSRTVAASTFDGRIHVFDAQTGTLKVSWKAYDPNIADRGGTIALALSSNGENLVSAATYLNLLPSEAGKVWDIRTGQLRTNLTLVLAPGSPYGSHRLFARWVHSRVRRPLGPDRALEPHKLAFRTNHPSPRSRSAVRRFFARRPMACIGKFRRDHSPLEPKTPLPPKPFHPLPPGGFAFGRSQDLRHIAVFFTNGTFGYWEVPSMRPIASWKTNHFPTFSEVGQISNGGTLAAWIGGDGSITLADIRAGRELTNWVVFTNNPTSAYLAFSYDDKTLATFGNHEQLSLWDLHPLRKRWSKQMPTRGVVFSTNNQQIYWAAMVESPSWMQEPAAKFNPCRSDLSAAISASRATAGRSPLSESRATISIFGRWTLPRNPESI